jgi:hypothetical protein
LSVAPYPFLLQGPGLDLLLVLAVVRVIVSAAGQRDAVNKMYKASVKSAHPKLLLENYLLLLLENYLLLPVRMSIFLMLLLMFIQMKHICCTLSPVPSAAPACHVLVAEGNSFTASHQLAMIASAATAV